MNINFASKYFVLGEVLNNCLKPVPSGYFRMWQVLRSSRESNTVHFWDKNKFIYRFSSHLKSTGRRNLLNPAFTQHLNYHFLLLLKRKKINIRKEKLKGKQQARAYLMSILLRVLLAISIKSEYTRNEKITNISWCQLITYWLSHRLAAFVFSFYIKTAQSLSIFHWHLVEICIFFVTTFIKFKNISVRMIELWFNI